MSLVLKVRVKLSGCHLYEQPVSLAFSNNLPNVGDLIEVPFDGRRIRARVTATSSPICRNNGSVTYVVYANEATEVAHQSHPSRTAGFA
jgi:hypothetical protein